MISNGLLNPDNMEVRALQLSQHRTLNHLDKNGFGIKMVTKTSAYLPPHWHYAVEILLFLNGTVTCQFSHTKITAHPGEIYIINSHDVHETRCTRDAKYLCIHKRLTMADISSLGTVTSMPF